MADERVVFSEEAQPREHVRLIACGEINELLLDALENFVQRQRKRLELAADPARMAGTGQDISTP